MSVKASSLAAFDDMLTEQQVCERLKHLVSDRELREARRKGEISFVTGKKGQISYHPDWIADYFKGKITPCHRPLDASGNTAITGSAALLAPTISMHVGGTSEQDERAAELLTRKFLPKLKTV